MFLMNPLFTIHLFTLNYEKAMFDLHTQLEGACRPGHGLAYFIRLTPQKAINNHCNSFNSSKHLYPGVTTRLLNLACYKCMYVEVYPIEM